MESLGLGRNTDIVLNWALRICVALLTYWGVQILDKINTTTQQMVNLGVQQQIMQHDLSGIEKRVERIEFHIEKLNEKKR